MICGLLLSPPSWRLGSGADYRAYLSISMLQQVRYGARHDMIELVHKFRPLSPGVLEDVVGQVQH